MGWGQLNILLITLILMHCIRIMILKSQRVVGALLADGVMGLEFDAWGCAWLL
jgi:hypothetical protein